MGMELPLPAIQRQIASGIDIIVHLGRMRDKSRKVLEIAEILGYENGVIRTQTLYEFREEKGVQRNDTENIRNTGNAENAEDTGGTARPEVPEYAEKAERAENAADAAEGRMHGQLMKICELTQKEKLLAAGYQEI